MNLSTLKNTLLKQIIKMYFFIAFIQKNTFEDSKKFIYQQRTFENPEKSN